MELKPSQMQTRVYTHMCTESQKDVVRVLVGGNVSSKCFANGQHLSEAGYKYINNTYTHTHTTMAKTWGLISHAQPVHLVNVKRAVIVNYTPI